MSSTRKRRGGYTIGEVNRLIDSLLHPLAKEDGRILIIDGFLHALVENNPPLSARKFLAYSLPTVLSELGGADKKTAKTAGEIMRQAMKFAKKSYKRSPR